MKNKVKGILIGIAVIFIPFLIGGLAELLLVADSSTGYIVSAVQIIFIVYYFRLRA